MTARPQSRPAATPHVQIDNKEVRVTKWHFAPGAETGWHRHACDYVVVPMTTAYLLIVSNDGEQHASMTAGGSYTKQMGVEHNVINDNPFDFIFIEVELKA